MYITPPPQGQLDKTREVLDESAAKAKADRSERELRVLQLESEVERSRGSGASRDARIEELTEQHHADRVKLHEAKESVGLLESERGALKSQLQHETATRQRLEGRLRSLMSTPEYEGGGF
ncbi:hypothetical protein B484DRAFT_471208, partial [Ochromonadaceae sp. CCMP2298]